MPSSKVQAYSNFAFLPDMPLPSREDQFLPALPPSVLVKSLSCLNQEINIATLGSVFLGSLPTLQ